MIKHSLEFRDYCPECGAEQEYHTNPMYMHICSKCKKRYGMSDLVRKEINKLNNLYKCLRYEDEDNRHNGAVLVMAPDAESAFNLAKECGDMWDYFHKTVQIDGVFSEGKPRVVYNDYSR